MPKLTPFWTLLETRPSRAAVMAEWRSIADGCLPVLERLLVPLEEPATAYPDPRGALPMRVVRHRDGSIVAVSREEGGGRLPLSAGDVVLYQVDLRRLRKAVSDALSGLAIARTPLDGHGRCLHVGNWEPKKAAAFPVHILFCTAAAALRQAVTDHVARNGKPGAILMTPTRANWDSDLEALARSHRLMLTPLDEVLSVDGDAFCETPAWEEYLQAFCQMVKLTLPSNFRNRKPIPRRATLTAKVEKVRNALVDYMQSAKDHVFAVQDAGEGTRKLHHLTKSELARLAGLKPYHITRCFQADPQLERLYKMANDPDELMKYV